MQGTSAGIGELLRRTGLIDRDRYTNRELAGRRALVAGLGAVGRSIAQRLMAQFRARAFDHLAGVAMASYPAPAFDGHSTAHGVDGAPIVAADDSEAIWLADFRP